MLPRGSRERPSDRTRIPGSTRLTLAKLIITLENFSQAFARPLMLAGFFLVLAWLGIFDTLYPWAHLVALALIVAVFFDALGRSRIHYRHPSLSAAKRRVEAASGLAHRPLDVLSDRPALANDEQQALWQAHLERNKSLLKNLGWPRWKASFAERDPFALRYALIILLGVGIFSSWGVWGGRLLTAINPALGPSLNLFRPALDAWITPPEYTGLAPIMIATPAGQQHKGDEIVVPVGSTITAHLAEKSGDTPHIFVNGQDSDFTTDDHQDFGVSTVLTSGDTISIRRGWEELGKWHIRVMPDTPPQVAFSEPPGATERKSVRLTWQATDDYGIASVTAKVTPRESLAGANNQPTEIDLASPGAKEVKRTSFVDLTSSPWAGLSVQIQLTATDAAGHEAQSEPVDYVLPERIFFNPIARALIEERKKLLQSPSDDNVRNEAANVMAGIAARRISDYRGDGLVLMALRAGAVRLVLNRSADAVPPVVDTLWQTSVRIEDGSMGVAQENLRQAQKELADALDRGADLAEIQQRIDRLHEALSQYLAQLSAQTSVQPPMNDELEQVLGQRTNVLTPRDLERMLEQMRDLSAAGDRDAAREELAKVQQLLENMHTGRPQLTADQKEALKRIAALRDLSKKEQQLLDKTFSQSQDGKSDGRQLAMEQEDLRRALRSLIDGGTKDDSTDDLDASDASMKSASADLNRAVMRGAVGHQNEALAALQKAIESMSDNMRASMFMLPRNSYGEGKDPFGRSGFSGFSRDDGGVRVPDQMGSRRVREILDELQRRAGDPERPKTERDYIDRLLQNF